MLLKLWQHPIGGRGKVVDVQCRIGDWMGRPKEQLKLLRDNLKPRTAVSVFLEHSPNTLHSPRDSFLLAAHVLPNPEKVVSKKQTHCTEALLRCLDGCLYLCQLFPETAVVALICVEALQKVCRDMRSYGY